MAHFTGDLLAAGPFGSPLVSDCLDSSPSFSPHRHNRGCCVPAVESDHHASSQGFERIEKIRAMYRACLLKTSVGFLLALAFLVFLICPVEAQAKSFYFPEVRIESMVSSIESMSTSIQQASASAAHYSSGGGGGFSGGGGGGSAG